MKAGLLHNVSTIPTLILKDMERYWEISASKNPMVLINNQREETPHRLLVSLYLEFLLKKVENSTIEIKNEDYFVKLYILRYMPLVQINIF